MPKTEQEKPARNRAVVGLTVLMVLNLSVSAVLAAPGPQWPDAGAPQETAIADGTLEQNRQKIVETSDGNFLIVWADGKSGTYNIYAQKTDPWNKIFWNKENPGTGIPIAVNSTDGDQPYHNLEIIVDPIPQNLGGSIIAWDAADSGKTAGGIFIKRLDMEGRVMPGWQQNGNQVIYEKLSTLKALVSDGLGGAYVAWIEDESANLYVAHIRGTDGTIDPKWNEGAPKIIQTSVDPQAPVKLLVPAYNNLIIVYGKASYLEALKTLSSSTRIWTAPVRFHNYGTNCSDYDILSDKDGGFFAAYHPFNGQDYDLKAQHINANGEKIWPEGTSICNAAGDQTGMQLVTDNITPLNGIILAWVDHRGANSEVYAQRINHLGETLWQENGIPVSDPANSLNKGRPQIVSNGDNGAIVTFFSEKSASIYNDVIAQHVSSSGSLIWPAGGVLVSGSDTLKSNLLATGDLNGGEALAWQGTTTTDANGNPVENNIYAQFVYDPYAPPLNCSGVAETGTQSSFCAQLLLIDPILTFINIPSSFSFQNIDITGDKIDRFNNYTTEEITYSDDLLGVEDTRMEGGFQVTVQADSSGFVSDGTPTQEMSLSTCNVVYDNVGTACLWVATSTSSDYVIPGDSQEIVNGIIYQPTGQTQENIAASQETLGSSLGNPTTYFALGANLGNTQAVVLMYGPLPASTGRNGKFYQYVNYYLKIPGLPAAQPGAGSYALTVTYTLTNESS